MFLHLAQVSLWQWEDKGKKAFWVIDVRNSIVIARVSQWTILSHPRYL